MSDPSSVHTASEALSTLLICGLFGMVGQGIRAVLGLKSASLAAAKADQQTTFNAAYFALSMMIGFIAGIIGGIIIGFDKLTNMNLSDANALKTLLGIAASGYAGADFIESSLSLAVPKAAPPVAPLLTQADTASLESSNTGPLAPNTDSRPGPKPSNTGPLAPNTDSRPGPKPDGSAALTSALSIVAPQVSSAKWVDPLIKAFAKFGLNSNMRVAAAIGQFLVEAGSGFQEVVEDMTYTHAARIVQMFPHAFPAEADAEPFVNHPEALGNKVYANRLGNGDEHSGDGYRFRGRGLIQLTGRTEYAQFGATIGKSAEDTAAYLETPEGAAMSGCWYLSAKGCLPLADRWALSDITRLVNGDAMVGDTQRIEYAKSMLKHLGGSA